MGSELKVHHVVVAAINVTTDCGRPVQLDYPRKGPYFTGLHIGPKRIMEVKATSDRSLVTCRKCLDPRVRN